MKTQISFTTQSFLLTLAVSVLFLPSRSSAVDLYASVGETTIIDSNVYGDASKEWDAIIQPAVSLNMEFAEFFAAGYDGFLEVYTRHADLLYHSHELYLLANPTWGDDGDSGFIGELSVTTNRNNDAYAALNLLEPMLFLELSLAPTGWFSVALSETVSYRLFYDDSQSDGVDSWTRAELIFTAPTRTTFKPRIVYGQRYYPRLTGEASADPLDQQLEAGLRIGQNLFDGAGIRLDYAYTHGFGTSATVVRTLDAIAFQYLGEAFLLTAHQVTAGIKFMFENGIAIDTSLGFSDKTYNGWPVRDELGEPDPSGKIRHDREIGPAALLSYTYIPGDDASPGVPELEVSLMYDYERNFSNDSWYDTDRHRGILGLELIW